MMRALMWKEWREQRSVVLAGLVVSVLLPAATAVTMMAARRPVDLPSLALAVAVFDVAVLWPLFAAVAGATTIAAERGEGTLDFLLTRPAARGTVWAVKVLLAATAWAAVIAASLAVGLALRAAAGEAPLAIDRFWIPGEASWLVWTGAGFGVLLFGASVFCSTFLSRPMTAAGAGLCLALAVGVSVLAVWRGLGFFLQPDPAWLAAELALLGALLLGGSLVAFARDEAPGASAGRRAAWLGAALAGGLAVAALPALATRAGVDPDTARVVSTMLAPAGDVVVAGLANDDGRSAEVWVLPTDGRPAFPLAPRPSWPVTVSPDGTWVVYLSARGPFGLSTGGLELRAVRVDGSGDRLLVDGLSPEALVPAAVGDAPTVPARVSPDGRLVAVLLQDERLLVLPLRGGRATAHVLPPFAGEPADRLVGWARGGREVLVDRLGVEGPRGEPAGFSLLAIDVKTGGHRSVVTIRGVARALVGRAGVQAPASGLSAVPLVVRERDCPDLREGWCPDVRLELVEVASGRRRVVATDRVWSPWDVDWDERRGRLAFTDGAGVSVYEAASGVASVWARLRPRTGSPVWSPGGERIALRTSGHTGRRGVAVVGRGGAPRTFEGRGVPLGWAGRDRVVLADGLGTPRLEPVAIVDVDGGTSRRIFPPP